ncbi:phage-related Clp protease [Bordetella ansorpii]|uniref:ATP-dependent Clp protease proteolytic subunit n=1 Tax=Bordetella ansorpii TaxID=288768 RepID=A0A157RLS0_9BORD|nr:head maturation protease, ClpP-related [Bordetella ansorpii]SAI58942.1 phage-related Clp protease [Bordetella ansorpii]
MAKKGNFYSIGVSMEASERVVTLRIYDDIGWWGKTAADFAAELAAAAEGASKIIVAINSGGGSVFDAFAMYNELRRYAGRTVGRVDGVCASAATLPLIACDTIEMPENAQLMIHEPTTVTWGTLAELKASIRMMENIIDSVIAAYVRRSGLPTEKIVEMMEATTWLSALDAQALGFCDTIIEPVAMAMSASSLDLISKFANLPEPIARLVDAAETPVQTAASPAAQQGGQPPATTATPVAAAPTVAAPPPEPAAVSAAAVMAAGDLAAHVFATCRSAQIPHLAESVMCSGGMMGREQADARIKVAQEIAGLCMAAKLPDMAAEMVTAGLGVEQARARLFDDVTQRAVTEINNKQQSDPAPVAKRSGANPQAIYAARREQSATPRN